MSKSNSGSIHLEREVESQARRLLMFISLVANVLGTKGGKRPEGLCSQHSICIQTVSPLVGVPDLSLQLHQELSQSKDLTFLLSSENKCLIHHPA